MKKSAVAVSVIVALGVAWTGASWYTGKQIEQRMSDLVAKVNTQLNTYSPQLGLKISYQDYQRGVFNSTLRYVLEVANPDKDAKQPYQVSINETITHGPFPHGLTPAMAATHAELANTPPLKELFEVTKGKSLFTADSIISYSGDVSSIVNFIPIDFQKDGGQIKFSGAKMNADIAHDLSRSKVDFTSDNLTILPPATDHKGPDKIVLTGMALSGNAHASKFGFNVGDQKMVIKQLTVGENGKDVVALDNFAITGNSSVDDKNFQLAITYAIDALKVQSVDFGAGKLAIKADKLDGQALQQLIEAYRQAIGKVGLQELGQNPEEAEKLGAVLAPQFLAMLKNNPSISIGPLNWKNSKGESAFNLQLDLNPLSTPANAPQIPTEPPNPLQVFKKLDATLSISMPMATELVTQAAKLQGMSEAEAAEQAKQQVQSLSAMGQMFKITTTKDNVISSFFHYADKQVDLNGQKMPLEQFIAMFANIGGGGSSGDDDSGSDDGSDSGDGE